MRGGPLACPAAGFRERGTVVSAGAVVVRFAARARRRSGRAGPYARRDPARTANGAVNPRVIAVSRTSWVACRACSQDTGTVVDGAGHRDRRLMRLARRAGLESFVTRIVTVPGGAGANAAAKVASIVAGMFTGADSILDMDGLREGAVGKVLPGVKAPSVEPGRRSTSTPPRGAPRGRHRTRHHGRTGAGHRTRPATPARNAHPNMKDVEQQ